MFKTLVGKDHPEFKLGTQQDAQEYFHHAMEKITRLEKANKNPNPNELFEFELETRVQCQECTGVKYSSMPAHQLTMVAPVDSSVPAGTKVEFDACVQRFFSDEVIPDFFCSQCNKKTICVKRQRFNSTPKVLLVVLQRFVYDQWVPKKLEIDLQIPQDAVIDFEKYKGNGG